MRRSPEAPGPPQVAHGSPEGRGELAEVLDPRLEALVCYGSQPGGGALNGFKGGGFGTTLVLAVLFVV